MSALTSLNDDTQYTSIAFYIPIKFGAVEGSSASGAELKEFGEKLGAFVAEQYPDISEDDAPLGFSIDVRDEVAVVE